MTITNGDAGGGGLNPPPMDYRSELQDAMNRVEYVLRIFRAAENDWEKDPADGMYTYKGVGLDGFLVKKHIYDLLREVWHLGDGIVELINEAWRQDKTPVPEEVSFDTDIGPGRAIVQLYIQSSKPIQLCGDLANLSKHYKLTRKTQTGDDPPIFGETALHMQNVTGGMELGSNEDGTRSIRLANPVPVRTTMVISNADGEIVGDALDIAKKATDSWLELLAKLGLRVVRPSGDVA